MEFCSQYCSSFILFFYLPVLFTQNILIKHFKCCPTSAINSQLCELNISSRRKESRNQQWVCDSITLLQHKSYCKGATHWLFDNTKCEGRECWLANWRSATVRYCLVCTENFFASLFSPFVSSWKRRVALLQVSNAKCALMRANQTPESWRLLFQGWLSLCFFSQFTLRAAHMPPALSSPLLFLSFLTIPLLFNLFYFLKPLSARMILAFLQGELLDTLHSSSLRCAPAQRSTDRKSVV